MTMNGAIPMTIDGGPHKLMRNSTLQPPQLPSHKQHGT